MKNISDILKNSSPSLSFEVYPPKTEKGMANLLFHLNEIKSFNPDFISVTYGAGGTNQDKSIETLKNINSNIKTTIVAHFTCIGLDYPKIDSFTNLLEDLGIVNILALRGDPPKNAPDFDFSKNVFEYASELVSYLKNKTKLCIGVAGYPEGHVEAESKNTDWDNLKKKVDAGASFIITQLFFDNDDFWSFKDELNKRNINIPVIPGILPVASPDVLTRAINLSGARLPDNFKKISDQYIDDPISFQKASLNYTYNQVNQLLEANVPGIHFYILNRSEIMKKLLPELNFNR